MVSIYPIEIRPDVVRVPSGRIHLRYEIDGRYVQDERCNLDQANDLVEIDLDRLSEADLSALCGFCFKDRN